MKKIFAVIVFFLCLSCLVLARDHRKVTFKFGYAGFKDINSGPTFGVNFGKNLDKQVVIGLETNIFRKSTYNELAISDSIYESGIYESTLKMKKESHRTIVPLTGTIDINIARHNRLPIQYKIGGSIGYQVLFGSIIDYQKQGTADRQSYGGWLWSLRTGLEYQISKTASFIGEVVYNRSVVSRASDVESDLPTKDTVNLSGLGARFGFSVAIDWR